MKSEPETFGNRMKASEAMRAKAKILEERSKAILCEAGEWRQLAQSLDDIERYSSSQSIDGNESPVPHIAVGSPAENLLWKLASDYQEKI